MRNKQAVQKIYPLSPMQEGILFHSLLDNSENLYFEQIVFTIQGDLDTGLLEKSFNHLIARHEVFRTIFIYQGVKTPKQVVLKERSLRLCFKDISGLREEEKQLFIDKFKKSDKENGFDLSKDLLIRISVLKTGERDYCVLWSDHHIVRDGWSFGIIIKELIYIYKSLKTHAVPSLEETEPYSNYILWLDKQNKAAALSYWVKYLEDYENFAVLPGFKRTVPGMNYSHGTSEFRLGGELVGELEILAKNCQVPFNALFQAVWGILLQRYNNTGDVVFGSVVSGRSPEINGVDQMVGLFINTIPVRVKCRGNLPFVEIVKEVRNSAAASVEYDYYPLAEIQSNTGLKQDLINHILVFENYPLEEELENLSNEFGTGFTITGMEMVNRTNYGLNVILVPEKNKDILVKFSYNLLMYDKSVFEKIEGHIKQIIRAVIKTPDIPSGEIELVTPDEKDLIVNSFNNTRIPYPGEKSIQELFEEQAKENAFDTAVVFEDESLTYDGLNRRANQLAQFLKEEGVKSGEIVGIMLGRSAENVIAMLGILKAGAVYLPIDHDYPPDRVAGVLEDCGPSLIITKDRFIKNFPDSLSQPGSRFYERILSLDKVSSRLSQYGTQNPGYASDSSGLAYIMYTSGSTGEPKGAMIEQRSIVRLVKNTNYIEFKKGDRILQTGAPAFDASTFEIWGSLLNGLSLYVVDLDVILDAELLGESLKKNGITTLWLTSPLFNQLAQQKEMIFCGLKNLLVGGDTLSPKYINLIKKRFPSLNIINGYGPTENTTFSLCFPIDKEYETNIPIGKPISNTSAYILSAEGQLQPVGVPGELCVGGDGVARGYLNRKELTEEKFVSNPFEVGGRLYKTGDLARWLPDGNVEFLGRADKQVKIRGFRIELGEIESQILKCEFVKEAVVVIREDENAVRYICAYISSDRELAVREVREHLSRTLPGYMVPESFICLERMPTTVNGKIDRKALPSDVIGRSIGAGYAKPRNELEAQLVKIWEDLLGKRGIGVENDFFELGGHSLKAMALVSRIYKELALKISLGDVYSKSTIKEMAGYIKSFGKNFYPPIEPANEKEYYPVTYAQKGLYILDRLKDGSTAYNIPRAVKIEGILDKEKIEAVFCTLVKRHAVFRTAFDLVEGEPVQRIFKDVDFHICYEELDESMAENSVRKFIKPFDLSKAPLLRVKLIKLSETSHIMMYDMHHIISDGTSMAIFLRELSALYNGRDLPDLNLQYKDFSCWKNKFCESGMFKEQEDYWLSRFSGDIPVLSLPADYERPSNRNFEGGRIHFSLGKEMTSELNKLAVKMSASLFQVLLAAYNTLLHRYSGQEDIVVGFPISGRIHSDLDNLIGLFVNMLALRSFPKGSKTFSEFLREVREDCYDAYSNMDYPYEMLVSKLALPRDASRNPLFVTNFSLQSIKRSDIQIQDLKLTPYEAGMGWCKFDFMFDGVEAEGDITFTLTYMAKLFKRETMEQFVEYFKNLIQVIIDNPGIKIEDIDFKADRPNDILAKEKEELLGSLMFGF